MIRRIGARELGVVLALIGVVLAVASASNGAWEGVAAGAWLLLVGAVWRQSFPWLRPKGMVGVLLGAWGGLLVLRGAVEADGVVALLGGAVLLLAAVLLFESARQPTAEPRPTPESARGRNRDRRDQPRDRGSDSTPRERED